MGIVVFETPRQTWRQEAAVIWRWAAVGFLLSSEAATPRPQLLALDGWGDGAWSESNLGSTRLGIGDPSQVSRVRQLEVQYFEWPSDARTLATRSNTFL